VKDWKNADAYPGAEEKNMNLWAWEFLRRNPEYKRDYAEVALLVAEYGADDVAWENHSETAAFSKLFECSPPIIDGETESQYVRRVVTDGHGKATLKTRYQATSDKYHISGWLPDPTLNWNETFSINFQIKGRAVSFHYRHLPETKMKITPPRVLDEVLVRFDLTRLLRTQVDSAKRQLKMWQKMAYGKVVDRRHHIKKLGTYLRVLDAMESGASKREMAAVIYPSKSNDYDADRLAEKSINNDISKAKEYRDGGYVTLVEK